ncbi:MAG: VanW family protein [Acidimicrobiales bacterium]|nr:VanW family protein [Acidimicrobiales bacterium]
MRRRTSQILIIVAVAVVSLVVLAAAGFAIDSSRHRERVARNVVLDGRLIGGLDESELIGVIESVAVEWSVVPVHLETPRGRFDTTLGQLGIALDRAAVRSAAMQTGTTGSMFEQFGSWLASVFDPRHVPLVFTLDTTRAPEAVTEAEAANHVDPVEPSLRAGDTEITVVAGAPGATLDAAAIAAEAKRRAEIGERDITLEVQPVAVPPRISEAEAAELAKQATELANQPLAIYIGAKSGRFDPKTVRSWFIPAITPAGLELRIDRSKAESDIVKVLGQVGTPVKQLSFNVTPANQVEIVEGVPGTRCCTDASLQGIIAALRAKTGRVELQLEPVLPEHDRAWAEKLGIVAPIGEFTTRYPCCQPRVTNIHLIADAMRGKLIEPGQTLSVNKTVGQRTKEKGYVEAPVIVDAKYSTDVGGGVSQFAATLFNAAFFAGLDIPTYQTHSIYIDRYPYGREATISWEEPDLEIRNNTPYGVLIWTSYTDTSVTVTLYSTPWIKGEQGHQTEEQRGPCKRVTTERIRTYLPNGKTEIDRFYALYQPAEGIHC